MVPDDRTILIEQSRDDLGDWRVCVLSPFGAQVHAPWAMALHARLSERWGIDVELMWSDDGIVIRIPDTDAEPYPITNAEPHPDCVVQPLFVDRVEPVESLTLTCTLDGETVAGLAARPYFVYVGKGSGSLQAFVDALGRAFDADPRWIAAAGRWWWATRRAPRPTPPSTATTSTWRPTPARAPRS